MADNAAEGQIRLRFVGQDSKEVHFRLKVESRLGKAKKAYADRMQVDVSTLRFIFDGNRIQDDDTAKSLGLEEDDVIDVFQHQHG